MSKVKKHVDWCLRKADKELKEKKDHKGLIKIKPDLKEARSYIIKAEHNLKALIFNKDSFSDWSINMGFYAMYHCCLAILAKFGYQSKNQECTLSAIEYLVEEKKIDDSFRQYIEKTQKKEDTENGEKQIMSEREETQYTPILEVDKDKVQELLELCQEMIQETKGVIE